MIFFELRFFYSKAQNITFRFLWTCVNNESMLSNQLLTYSINRTTESLWLTEINKVLQELGNTEGVNKDRKSLRKLLKQARFHDSQKKGVVWTREGNGKESDHASTIRETSSYTLNNTTERRGP